MRTNTKSSDPQLCTTRVMAGTRCCTAVVSTVRVQQPCMLLAWSVAPLYSLVVLRCVCAADLICPHNCVHRRFMNTTCTQPASTQSCKSGGVARALLHTAPATSCTSCLSALIRSTSPLVPPCYWASSMSRLGLDTAIGCCSMLLQAYCCMHAAASIPPYAHGCRARPF